MKITLVNGNFKPAWGCGGPARLAYELACFFRDRGYDVTVVTSTVSGTPVPLEKGLSIEDGIRVVRVAVKLPSSAWACSRDLWPMLESELRSSTAAIVFNTRSAFSIMAGVLCRRLSIPYVLAAVGSLPGGRSALNRALRHLIDPAIVYPNCQNARACIAQNENEIEEYRQIHVARQRIRLVPLACDASRFASLPARGRFREQIGVPPEAQLALFVGRLHFLKGLDTLVKASDIVRRRNSRFRLAIVGKDYGDEQRLRDLVKQLGLTGTVLFSGPQYEQDAVQAYTDADLYAICPRHFEETSLASIEAAFCATPLIFSAEASAPFFVENGAAVQVANSPESVAAAFLAIFADSDRLTAMGVRARQTAFEHFSMENIGAAYEACFATTTQTLMANA